MCVVYFMQTHISYDCYIVTNKMHTLRQYYDKVSICILPHVSGLTGPSSGSARLYKTIIQPLYHSQHVELSQVCQCTSIVMDMCTVTGAAGTHTQGLVQLLCTHPSLYSYIDKLVTIQHIGNDRWVGKLFYTTVHSLIMGQQGPKHVGFCTLKHYCNYKEVCAFVGHTAATESQ